MTHDEAVETVKRYAVDGVIRVLYRFPAWPDGVWSVWPRSHALPPTAIIEHVTGEPPGKAATDQQGSLFG